MKYDIDELIKKHKSNISAAKSAVYEVRGEKKSYSAEDIDVLIARKRGSSVQQTTTGPDRIKAAVAKKKEAAQAAAKAPETRGQFDTRVRERYAARPEEQKRKSAEQITKEYKAEVSAKQNAAEAAKGLSYIMPDTVSAGGGITQAGADSYNRMMAGEAAKEEAAQGELMSAKSRLAAHQNSEFMKKQVARIAELENAAKSDEGYYSYARQGKKGGTLSYEPALGRGNIDLNNRPVVNNPDGSVSTVYSMTFGPEEDGKYVLVPGVRFGLDRQMTEEEAYNWYQQTGQHLGKFDTLEEADSYAEQLHQDQEARQSTFQSPKNLSANKVELAFETAGSNNIVLDEGGELASVSYELPRYTVMTEDERNIYAYYLAKEGEEKAQEYLDALERDLDQRKTEELSQEVLKASRKNKAVGVAANVASSFHTPLAYAGTAAQNIKNLVTGEYEPVNTYSPAMLGVNLESASREGVVGDIENPMGRFLAETGLSMTQYLSKLPLGPGAALFVMSSGAAGNAAVNAANRGATAGEALSIGTIAGVAEYVTERIPMRHLYAIFENGGKAGAKAALMGIARQAGEEGAEEIITEYVNLAADNIIMTDRSEMNRYIEELMASGLSRDAAEEAAKKEFLIKRPLIAAAGGALSGAGMAGVGTAWSGASDYIGQRSAENADARANAAIDSAYSAMRETGLSGARDVTNTARAAVDAAREASGETYIYFPTPDGQEAGDVLPKLSMEDFTNRDSSVWNNVDYADDASKKVITQRVAGEMLSEGRVVEINEEDMNKFQEYYPDLRTMKKAERKPIIKSRINQLKDYLGNMLERDFKGKPIEFEVNGNILEARLYDTGIRELLTRIKKEKAAMIDKTGEIFANARYLYSTQDKRENSNIYRWNYFYIPLKIGDAITGVRIAVRDVISAGESQIYHYGINDEAASPPNGPASITPGESSGAQAASFNPIISQDMDGVNDIVPEKEQKDSETEEEAKGDKGLLTVDEAKFLAAERKRLERLQTKARRQNPTTDGDEAILKLLLFGDLTFDQIPPASNIGAIKARYEAEKPLWEVRRRLDAHKRAAKGRHTRQIAPLVETIGEWGDKIRGLLLNREIAERNIEDIVPDKAVAKKINEIIFNRVHAHEADARRFINRMVDRIEAHNISKKKRYRADVPDGRGLKVSRKVSEAEFVMLLGEGKITSEEVTRAGADIQKIQAAVQEFRSVYKEVFDMVNEVLVENGYDPVEYRADYFPHYRKGGDDIITKAFSFLGYNFQNDKLPTDIAGLTHIFRPGKNFVQNFLQRQTDVTGYDSLEGFDRYIEAVAGNIFHTGDIQRIRAFEDAVRYHASEEGIQERIDDIQSDPMIAEEDRAGRIKDIYESGGRTHLANFAAWLRQYGDILAGKKDINDRAVEYMLGRDFYDKVQQVMSHVGANMVALNPGSWLTNFIPIAQASALVSNESLSNAIKDTVSGYGKSDGLWDKSDFLTNRRGSQRLSRDVVQRVNDTLTTPFYAIDEFSAEVVVRARYYDNMRNGMDADGALEEAGRFAARLMADRSKGSMPLIFNQKAFKLFTMFQLEVNNQLSFFFKDVPRELKGNLLAILTALLFKAFLGSYLYNDVYEKVTGRRAAFDPIDIANDLVGDLTGKKLPNTLDAAEALFKGEVPGFKEVGKKTPGEAVANLGRNVVEELPFVGGFLGGGRFPVEAAVPDAGKLYTAATGEMDPAKKRDTFFKELSKPLAYTVLPFGGGQVKKAVEGISTVKAGGSYGMDSEGRPLLQFPVEDKSPWTYAKAGVFGKYALPRAQEYIDSSFKSLTAAQTEKYHAGLEMGIDYDTFMRAYIAQKEVVSDKDAGGDTIYLSASRKKKAAIDAAGKDLDRKQREFLYEAFGVSEKVYK